GARRLVLGVAGVAALSPAPRISVLAGVATAMGTARLALDRAARAARGLPGLGILGTGARPVRTLDVPGRAGTRLRHRQERGAERPLRPQPVHRHVRLCVRRRLEARDVDRLQEAERGLLLQLLADA